MTNFETWAEKEMELLRGQTNAEEDPKSREDLDYINIMDTLLDQSYEYLKLIECEKDSVVCSGLREEILRRMINQMPLTPITDADDEWKDEEITDNLKVQRAKRYFVLERKVATWPDGTQHVTYNDPLRIVCHDISNPFEKFYNGFFTEFVNDLIPIQLPYMPSLEPIHVVTETEEHEDGSCFVKILYILDDYKYIPVNRAWIVSPEGEMTQVE